MVPLPLPYDQRSRSQIKTTVRAETGIATANHDSHDRGGSMYSKAIRFCGEEMGDDWPPMLDARAMPRMRGLLNDDLGGKVRRIGCPGPTSQPTQRTGHRES